MHPSIFGRRGRVQTPNKRVNGGRSVCLTYNLRSTCATGDIGQYHNNNIVIVISIILTNLFSNQTSILLANYALWSHHNALRKTFSARTAQNNMVGFVEARYKHAKN